MTRDTTADIYAVLWKEASYTYEDIDTEIPPNLLRLTCGLITNRNDRQVTISTNSAWYKSDKKALLQDGFIIPMQAIISIEKISTYE